MAIEHEAPADLVAGLRARGHTVPQAVLKFKQGETYRLHLSSMDLLHGFSLFPLNLNFMVLPGYEYVLTVTPTEKGEVFAVCNEFCGIGHHQMVGKIIVE